MRICQQCGFENHPNAKFCRGCGAKLEEIPPAPRPVCPQCGAPFHIGTKFCRSCGARLDAVPPPPQPDPSPESAPLCPRCGNPVAPNAVFCGSCGAPMTGEADHPQAEPERPEFSAAPSIHLAKEAAGFLVRAAKVAAAPTPGETAIKPDQAQQAAIAAAVKALRGGR